MTQSIRYLLDANVFVTAKRSHYGFDFCPGFWDALLNYHDAKRLHSITPVRKELLKGKDDLSDWVKSCPPKSFFKDIADNAVVTVYGGINEWVNNRQQFKQSAINQFLSGADPWLIAYANVNDYQIVTYEVASSESKAKIKLPDVASQFGVVCKQPSEMLRELPVRLRYSNHAK